MNIDPSICILQEGAEKDSKPTTHVPTAGLYKVLPLTTQGDPTAHQLNYFWEESNKKLQGKTSGEGRGILPESRVLSNRSVQDIL